ncbi:MAG: hypothetical protein KDK90_24480 [Leptospiraceae bacterium]|nr:hypothetical protein [Leptospiraceae bacterium]
MDLRNWNFEQDGLIQLRGEWEFYWKKLYSPEDIERLNGSGQEYFYLPSLWNNFQTENGVLSGDGYATFSLLVLLDSNQDMWSLKVPHTWTANIVYAGNETKDKAGLVAKDVTDMKPSWKPYTLDFYPNQNKVRIVLQISNFHHKKGGAPHAILLGKKKQIHNYQSILERYLFFLLGCLIIMGLYHLGFFLNRKDELTPLYFSLLCFLIGIYLITVQEEMLEHIFPGINWELAVKIEFLSYYLALPVLVSYFFRLFPYEFNIKVITTIHIIGFLLSSIVIFTPVKIFSHTLIVFEIYAIISCLYCIYELLRSVAHKRMGASVFLFSICILLLTILNDILYNGLWVDTFYMTPLGFFVFLFSQAFLLSIRFSQAFHQIEELNQNLEKKVEERTLQLTNANQIKSEFIANISHEIRTPLNSILGFSEILKNEITNKTHNKYLSCVIANGKILLDLINSLLEISKIEVTKPIIHQDPIDIHVIVLEMVGVFSQQIQDKSLDFKTDINGSTPNKLLVDQARLKHVLLNLIGNAIKFTDKGSVKLSVYHEPGRSKEEINLFIAVEDSGKGISKEKIYQIFKRQSSVEYEENSFGLTICNKLVKAMNGKIIVGSEEGKGSIFIVKLNQVKVAEETVSQKNEDTSKSNTKIAPTYFQNIFPKDSKELKELQNILEGNLFITWKELFDILDIDVISNFAKELTNLGKTYNYRPLVEYGNNLENEIEVFDYDQIYKLLPEYQEILSGLSNQ